MKHPFNKHGRRLATITALSALTGALFSQTVFAAQPPEGPGGGPGGPGGPGGFRRPGGPGGPGGRRGGGPRPISISTLPAKAIASALGLSSDQTAKITAIQDSVKTERQKLMPAPGGDQGAPPDRETMQANREKMRTLDQKAVSDIEAVLTVDQKSAVPDLLKTLNVLGRAGVSPEIFGDLKMTVDQRKQLAALPVPAPPRFGGDAGAPPPPNREAMQQERKQTDDKVMAILTTDQKKIVEAFQKTHPRPLPGEGGGPRRGGGGFGPPPGGDAGAPPPQSL